MSSNVDKEFIKNLQNFTDALGAIVEMLDKQKDKGDAVSGFASAMDGDKIGEIAKDIKDILTISKKVDTKTDQILQEIKTAKKEKETNQPYVVENESSKKKIVDGIGVIMLIAVGVLAIGMAFKIIGMVDFLSVMALSAAIVLVSYAFAKIGDIKGFTYSKMFLVGLSIVVMALSITASSMILQQFQPLTPEKMLSLVFVSAALGIATYLIFKAAGKIKFTDLPKYFLLPILLPLIAIGIAESSKYLNGTQEVGIKQAISAIFVGIILGIGALSVYFILKAIKDVTLAKMVMVSVMIPIIAGGIVLASIILKHFVPVENWKELLLGSLAIGAALLIFSIPMYVLGKMSVEDFIQAAIAIPLISGAIVWASKIFKDFQTIDGDPVEWGKSALAMGVAVIAFVPSVYVLSKIKDLKSLGMGALGVVVVALALTAVSWIIPLGKYGDNIPSYDWSLRVGLALTVFTIPLMVVGLLAMAGVGIPALALGLIAIPIVAAALVISSHLLKEGTYSNYPDIKWSAGVGLGLLAFTIPMMAMGVLIMASLGLGAGALLIGAGAVLVVSATIVEASKILKGGEYDKYPTFEWSAGAGLALLSFGTAMVALGLIPFASKILKRGDNLIDFVAQSIVDVASILAGGNYTGGPTKEWSEGIGLSLGAFAQAASFSMQGGNMFKKGELDPELFANFMRNIANAMIEVADVFNNSDKINWDNLKYPKKEWGEGVSAGLSPFIELFGHVSNSEQSKRLIQDLQINKGDNVISILFKSIANTMVDVANILNKDVFKGGPDDLWTSNFSNLIDVVVKASENIDTKKIKTIREFSNALLDLSNNTRRLNQSGLDKLQNLTSSIKIVSIIDNNKLQDTLNILSDNKEKLSNIIDSNKGTSIVDSAKQRISSIIQPTQSKTDVKSVSVINEMNVKFDRLLEKFDELIELNAPITKSEDVGTPESK